MGSSSPVKQDFDWDTYYAGGGYSGPAEVNPSRSNLGLLNTDY